MGRFDNEGIFWTNPVATVLRSQGKGPPPLRAPPKPLVENWDVIPLVLPARRKPPELDTTGKPKVVMDIECYVNYFLVMFVRLDNGKVGAFEQFEGQALDSQAILDILAIYEVITFNGNCFDMPLLRLALVGTTNETLKEACNAIIKDDLSPWAFEKRYRLPPLEYDHIDLIEVAPGASSLKTYGGRLHTPTMQDLPFDPDLLLTPEDMTVIRGYCRNDCEVTKLLYLHLLQQITLRRAMSEEYNLDLRSRSDPQIAEEIIKAELTRVSGQRPVKRPVVALEFLYQKPDFIEFTNPNLQAAIDIVTTRPFSVNAAGRITMPKELASLRITIGNSTYQLGMGGLHSTEARATHISDGCNVVSELDVTSFYPRIILNCRLYPKNLGPLFLTVYEKIVTERLAAKAAGDKVKAESLKICVNGSFGKLGSPYSTLYAPELMVQVTVTGQLSLLMLIDQLESNGIPVVSGNTDGVVVKCPVAKEEQMEAIRTQWQLTTGFVLEQTFYAGIYSRDVNNYIAIKYDGTVKAKGCYSGTTMSKNPQNEICNIAVAEYLKCGRPFRETIMACRDITKFVSVRNVKGGAIKDKEYLGKVVRWYYATGAKGTIDYKTNGNSVPKTNGAKPLMVLPDMLPMDVDYEWYIRECKEML